MESKTARTEDDFAGGKYMAKNFAKTLTQYWTLVTSDERSYGLLTPSSIPRLYKRLEKQLLVSENMPARLVLCDTQCTVCTGTATQMLVSQVRQSVKLARSKDKGSLSVCSKVQC